ncbi:hypothetical protein BU17DRAFT_70551 [Hysterangium stoloniferum]|nr:hypothetical protein BU17DRAFT_70551 [Hysterangium stoloniferum]
MLFFSHFTAVLLLHLSSFALGQKLGQQITFITPTSNTPIPQCGQVPIKWSGGVSPYTLSISTTSNATIDSVEITPVEHDTTDFTISINDGQENAATTPVLTVQPSSNTTCLDSDDADPPTATTHDGHGGQISTSTDHSVSPSQTNNNPSPATKVTPTTGNSGHAANSSGTTNASSRPHVAAIAGIVIGVVVILVVVALLFFLKRRNNRRRKYTTSRDNLVATFGRDKAGLDDAPADELAIPEPYVYRSINRSSESDPVSVAEERSLRRNPTTTTSNSRSDQRTYRTDGSTENTSTTTTASRKGERYLPNLEERSTNNPGASSNLPSRMQDEDIDRLAARMVAMMSSGRMSDQAWSPAPRDAGDKDILLEDISGPPLYNEVTRGE